MICVVSPVFFHFRHSLLWIIIDGSFFFFCKLLLGPLVGMFITYLTLAWMPSDRLILLESVLFFLRSRWYKSLLPLLFPLALLTSHRHSLTVPVIILLFLVFTWLVPVNIILSFECRSLLLLLLLTFLLFYFFQRSVVCLSSTKFAYESHPAISITIRIPRRYSRLVAWSFFNFKLSLINGLSSVR